MQRLLLPAHYRKDFKPSKGVITLIKDLYHKEVSMGGRFGLGAEASCEVLDGRTGKPVPFRYGNQMVMETPWEHNLITNVGMNRVASNGFFFRGDNDATTAANSFGRSVVGTGSSSNKFHSGATTASQTGTTITLSSSMSAVASERVIKWDSGEVSFITTGDGLSWTAQETKEVPSGPFTVYDTNRTTLDAGAKNTLQDGNWSTTHNVSEGWRRWSNVWTHSAESSSTNYNELAWTAGNLSSAAAQIANRIVLPSSVTVETGQQLRVRLRATVFFSPITPAASSFVASGWDTGAVTEQCINIGALVSGSSNALDPTAANPTQFHNVTSLPAFGTGNITQLSTTPGTGSVSTYVTNSFERTLTSNFTTAQGNAATIRGLTVYGAFACLFENPVTKADTHTLTTTFRRSWDRAYV